MDCKYLFQVSLLLSGLLISCGEEEVTPSADSPKPTVIVYMAANNDLAEYAVQNVDQMEAGLASADLNLLVYLHTPEGARILRIQPNTQDGIQSPEVLSYAEQNSSDPATMEKVLNDARGLFPSDSYGLILWSHASSWMPPGSRPSTLSFGSEDGVEMDIRELKEALPGHYQFIAFDACSMASAEVAYELRNKADYIVASPTETIATGMPYHLVASHFFEGRDGLEEAAEKYISYYEQQSQELFRSATVSIILTSELEALAGLSRQLLEEAEFGDSDYHREELQRLDFETPPATESYDLLDFFETNLPQASLEAFRQQLDRTVLLELHTSKFLGNEIETFCGLSCYVPHEGDNFLNNYYKNLEWTKSSGFELLIR